MAKAKNKVIAGDYKGKTIISTFGGLSIPPGFTSKGVEINKDNVEEYEVITEESRKSATSAVGRAFVGGVILGPVGWLAGLSAKSKGIHTVAIQFKDGKKSLIEIDDKIYSTLIKVLF
ncbi:hypothetical protein [Heyndrickxia oleronia]|jgi:hypothetical protein|uniref:hypothetical protein n=1 Tax=Heyndrickxia oleronia TaxID=38875 RepID=UPI00242C24C0|nr:hypothetical protein [Heyndrickxia oleronia]MCI1615410.1 hypothetical protein [Heyndrickxia oleronia]MCI1746575.1 hypothetical protein [Heyndrickxia oleronia]